MLEAMVEWRRRRTEVGSRKSDAVVHRLVQPEPVVRGCSASRAGATGSCRVDGAWSFAQRVCTEPGSAPTRDRIPGAIAGQLVLCERGDKRSASEVLGQPVKISTTNSVILDPLAATTRAPVLGAAGEPGGRADEANMTRSL